MSSRRVMFLALAVSMLMATLFATSAQGAPDRPSRVVIIVLDQARPDTISRYHMKNVQELQRKGTSFPDALVGDMAAETVISHNVITSGLFPKNMGWTNEVYRDTDGVLGTPGAYHITSSMSCAQFRDLIAHGNYPKLQDYLDSQFGQSSSFGTFTQKRTSACTGGHTSPAADGTGTDPEDIILQIRGSRRTCNTTEAQWREPESGNLPAASAAAVPRHPDRRLQQPLVDQPGRGEPLVRHERALAREHLSARGQPLRAGLRPGAHRRRQLVRRRRDPADQQRPELARHHGEPRSHRQDGPHVGPGGQG